MDSEIRKQPSKADLEGIFKFMIHGLNQVSEVSKIGMDGIRQWGSDGLGRLCVIDSDTGQSGVFMQMPTDLKRIYADRWSVYNGIHQTSKQAFVRHFQAIYCLLLPRLLGVDLRLMMCILSEISLIFSPYGVPFAIVSFRRYSDEVIFVWRSFRQYDYIYDRTDYYRRYGFLWRQFIVKFFSQLRRYVQ